MHSASGPSHGQLVAAMLAGVTLLSTACGPRWDTHASSTTSLATSTSAAAPSSASSTPSTSTSAVPESSTSAATSTVPGTEVGSTTTAQSTVEVTSTTVDAAATIATITANWETFFAPTSSIDDRVALLENGESLRAAVDQRAKDPLMGQASAKVSDVELSAPDTATVTYDVLLSGAVALPNAQGTAVLRDGVWKVGAASFCALVSLGATAPIPGC